MLFFMFLSSCVKVTYLFIYLFDLMAIGFKDNCMLYCI